MTRFPSALLSAATAGRRPVGGSSGRRKRAANNPYGCGGIARYIRYPSDPQAAEIAVTVADGWQGRGLGTELIRQLSRHAWRAGIRRFTAMAMADNVAAIRLLRTLGARAVRRGIGAVEYEITLKP